MNSEQVKAVVDHLKSELAKQNKEASPELKQLEEELNAGKPANAELYKKVMVQLYPQLAQTPYFNW